jgi:hypothetical protein
MDGQSRKEAAEIKNLPVSLLEYLPAPRWRSLSALIVVIILLIIFFGYMLNTHIRYARLEAELNRYESLWESKAISDYEYTLRTSDDEGYSQVVVRVEDGASISEGLENTFTSKIYEVPAGIGSLDTVPDLFNRIRKALEDRDENGVSKLVIRYDTDLGYPTHIELTSQPEGQLLRIQGNYAYTIYDFKILEPKETRYARLEAGLDSHEKLWESKEISSYEYTFLARTGEGHSEVHVRFKDGISTSEVSVKDIPLDIDSFDMVPDLFNRIRKAIESREEEGFNQLSIQYNEDTGYPTYITLRDSYRVGDPGVYSYSIIDFKILEQGQTAN